MWTREGVFLYPPRRFWDSVKPSAVAAAWKGFKASSADRPGLYVHFPAELAALAEFYAPRKSHPYLDCLEREAELLKLPKKLPVKTLYLGAGGTGAMTHLPEKGIERLMKWLKFRFGLKSLEQAIAEVDASAMNEEKARLLARGGIDRVTTFLPHAQRRKAFSEGVRLCRKEGIRYLSIDVAGSSPVLAEEDVEFALSLKPDSVHLYGPEEGLEGLRKRIAAVCPGSSAANNLQLFHATEFNASIVGLGWGAVSHLRGRLLYAPADSCFKHVDALLRDRKPGYAGARLNAEAEMRTHVIRSLEDNGGIDRTTFKAAFGREPEKVFPKEFSSLIEEKRIARKEGRFAVVSTKEEGRYICSVRFYGATILRRLTREPAPGRSGRPAPEDAALGRLAGPALGPRARTKAGIGSAAQRLNDEGVGLFALGDSAGAARLFDKALRAEPKNIGLLLNRGASAAAQGDLEAALGFYERVPRANPSVVQLADSLSARAGALAQLGRSAEAVKALEGALAGAPRGWPRRAQVEKELASLRGKS